MISIQKKHLGFLKVFRNWSQLSKDLSDLKKDKVVITSDGNQVVFSLFHNRMGGIVKILDIVQPEFTAVIPIETLEGLLKTVGKETEVIFEAGRVKIGKGVFTYDTYKVQTESIQKYLDTIKDAPQNEVVIENPKVFQYVASNAGERQYASVGWFNDYIVATDRVTKFGIARVNPIEEPISLDPDLCKFIAKEKRVTLALYKGEQTFWMFTLSDLDDEESPDIMVFCTSLPPEAVDLTRPETKSLYDHRDHVVVSRQDMEDVVSRMAVVATRARGLYLVFGEHELRFEDREHNKSSESLEYIRVSPGYREAGLEVWISTPQLLHALAAVEGETVVIPYSASADDMISLVLKTEDDSMLSGIVALM